MSAPELVKVNHYYRIKLPSMPRGHGIVVADALLCRGNAPRLPRLLRE